MSSKLQRARRARKGDKSFQPGGNGKGDADRTGDIEAYRRNFAAIAWSSPPASCCDCKSNQYCENCDPERCPWPTKIVP